MSGMLYKKIPYVDRPVSRILYGTAAMPFLDGGDGNALFDDMFALGVNTFDTARNYKAAEASLGKWIDARQNREEIVILSKCGHPDDSGKKRVTEYDMREDFRTSAEYLCRMREALFVRVSVTRREKLLSRSLRIRSILLYPLWLRILTLSPAMLLSE